MPCPAGHFSTIIIQAPRFRVGRAAATSNAMTAATARSIRRRLVLCSLTIRVPPFLTLAQVAEELAVTRAQVDALTPVFQ